MKRNKIITVTLLTLSHIGFTQVSIKKTIDAQVNTKPVSTTNNQAIKDIRRTRAQAYDFSNVKICIDRVSDYDPGPRPTKTYREIPRINSNGQIVKPNSVQQPLTVETKKMWPSEQQITVAFAPNEASNIVIEKVKQYARVWETVANVKFLFTNDWHNALVKVGFTPGGSWSWIGRDVLRNPYGQKTMNYGWFKNDTPDEEFRRVILHEFGHVLGFIHEHQSAGADIHWDAEKVYAFFAQSDNWSRSEVDKNIFYKYSQTSTNGTAYDRTSIMHYFFPQGLTTDNSVFTSNTMLSPLDKQFAREIYPFPPTIANASGVLHTGDDCDAINFTVEYNVLNNNNVIEFVLKPGVDNAGKPITWWKQIGIPLKAGGENRNLQLAPDLKPAIQQLLLTDIDDTRGFSFAKAKILGVHTGLGFAWNVWQALPGGCRVTFTWQNDHCY